jgi:hypothetical protein
VDHQSVNLAPSSSAGVSPDITVLAFDTVQIAGTDHAAVVARLALR